MRFCRVGSHLIWHSGNIQHSLPGFLSQSLIYSTVETSSRRVVRVGVGMTFGNFAVLLVVGVDCRVCQSVEFHFLGSSTQREVEGERIVPFK